MRFDGPQWPDPGQGARIGSFIFMLVAVFAAWSGYMRWEMRPNGYRAFLDELFVLFFVVLAIVTWRKRRWR